MIGGKMFWRKKPKIDPRTKKRLIEELTKLRNHTMIVVRECEDLIKKVKEL
jgi:hypothetical protein